MSQFDTGQIRQFIVTNFLFGDDSQLQDDTSFMEKGIIDSTGILELIMFLEQQFGISIAEDEMLPENMDSLNKLGEFLSQKCDAAVKNI